MFVVKVGGAEGNGIDNVLIDLAPRRDYVLVHGGSNEVDRLAEALGRPIRWLTSPSGIVSRYTDRETMEVFTMALTGKLNTTIVARLQSLGAPAVGLSGVDGGLLTGRRKEAVRSVDNGRVLLVKDDHSGTNRLSLRQPCLRLIARRGSHSHNAFDRKRQYSLPSEDTSSLKSDTRAALRGAVHADPGRRDR